MENQEFKKFFNQHITDYAQQNQYGVSMVPFHIHNGVDSPQIDPAALLGFPTLTTTDANVAPTNTPTTGTFRFYFDGNEHVIWVMYGTVWQPFPPPIICCDGDVITYEESVLTYF